ncbi:hypothetical protein Prudu_001726 [Prunus dulcis]|uniref:Reticulon domain-containing protein n=1 Tax=Prunus dulcis TaxID=3755 RepID=A0A4Y1QPB4_PRUDU|nr:hypothetical protein Prudu_001726 [Prunus dulcis]
MRPDGLGFDCSAAQNEIGYSLEIPEMVVKDMIATIACLWNRGVCYMRLLALGDDWEKNFKFAASLYCLKLVSSHCGDSTGVSFHAVFHIRAV